jgi:sterol desaturase/sphingolipid hydroxylase (fatty acid hydroxylase superfamily)
MRSNPGDFVWVGYALASVVRYVVIAGIAYVILYKLWPSRFSKLKLQPLTPGTSMILREAGFSLLTMLIYAAVTWVVFVLERRGDTMIYRDIRTFSFLYFLFSIVLMILLHDTYFYWTHRFLHLPWIFRHIHARHHQSTNPTPWAAFSFHPGEAIVSAGIILLIVVIIPCHPLAIGIFLLYMTIINVMGHLGYELFTSRFRCSVLGRLQNTATNHNVHHQYGRWNYGLYFTFWDQIMRTYRRM